MFVQVELEFALRQDALTVPLSALVRSEDRQGVFLVDTQTRKVRFVPVRTGIADGERVEILEPPLAGLVVTLGQHLLQNGASVLLPEAGPPPAAAPQSSSGGVTR